PGRSGPWRRPIFRGTSDPPPARPRPIAVGRRGALAQGHGRRRRDSCRAQLGEPPDHASRGRMRSRRPSTAHALELSLFIISACASSTATPIYRFILSRIEDKGMRSVMLLASSALPIALASYGAAPTSADGG